jgi:nucleoside-diphosphate-sugar epimerase
MQIIITGGGGFLGQRLAQALLNSPVAFEELLLVDMVLPANPSPDARVRYLAVDLTAEGAAAALVTTRTGIIFHLAAVTSSHAEDDFDLGWQVNLEVTRQLLEACRHTKPGIRLVFASSLAVFGGLLPAIVNDSTAVTPRSSFGTQKAMGELLLNDYTRKGFVDGLALRLPTICVRPGRPNHVASSFVSSIIREPLHGEPAICPVPPDLNLWLSSPVTVIHNLLHAAALPRASVAGWRTINLPGISVTVQQMLDAMGRLTDAATVARVRFEPNESINAIVSSWPGAIDNTRALQLGFEVDAHFDSFISQYMAHDMQQAS